MVYGILKFINFAHGEIFMVGSYLGFFFAVMLGMNIYLAAILSILLTALLGIVIEKIAYKPLRYSPRLIPLITAIGISFFLQGLVLLLFGSDIKTYRTKAIPESYSILGANVTGIQLIIIAATVILMLLLCWFIKRTKLGKAMRATADNYDVAAIIGINIDKVISATFAIGSALAAVAGILVGIERNLQPTMGIPIGIAAFAASVVGGIGNIWGAVLGGFLIGFAENFGIWFIPSGYKDAIAFLILVFMLLFRPTGILGQKQEEEVKV